MKQIIYFVTLTIGLSIISCTPDKKDDPINPSSDERDKYIGTWQCNENSQVSGSTSYTITISKSSTASSEILIDHFYDLPAQARATVSGNSIIIPYQQLSTLGFTSGSGVLSSNSTSLSLAYTTTVSGNPDNSTANCVKQ